MEARYPSESDFQQEVVRKLERYNWDVQTEVRSDCGSYRVDMIIEHRCVEPIGLELKNLGGLSSKKLVGGIKQALQYREATYNGESIELWGVAVSLPSEVETQQAEFMRGITNDFGLGFADFPFAWDLHFGNGYSVPLVEPHKAGSLNSVKGRSKRYLPDW